MVAISSMATAIGRSGAVVRTGMQVAARVGGLAVARLPRPVIRRGPADADGGTPPASSVTVEAPGLPAVTMAYERHGRGEPVVLLHGLGLNRHTWDAVTPLLTGEREVIAIDLPGFGQSPDWPAKGRDLPTMVTLLGEAFTALGAERPHVVGHSLGGLIGLRLAQAGLVRSVTALAPAGFWTEAERRYAFAVLFMARRIARTTPDAVAERLSATAGGRAILAGMLYGDPAQCPPGAVVACLHALRDATGFEATLRAGRAPGLFTGTIPDVPVTIAWGTQDRILPARQARRATATLPQARLVLLPGCGHTPMNDAPQTVADLILHATDAVSRPKLASPGT